MNHTRPKHLNLLKMKFSISAIVSIFHRLSGVGLFLLLPLIIWGFSLSLSEVGFMQLQEWGHTRGGRLLLWFFLLPLIYHLIAGMRHLFIDLHIGETRRGGKWLAQSVLVLFWGIALLLGVWLW